MRNLAIERNVLVFKSLEISKKVIHNCKSFITVALHVLINQLNNIQKELSMEQKKSKNKNIQHFQTATITVV